MTQSSQTIVRSRLYQEMMPDDLVLPAFGKLNPTLAERTSYFFSKWLDTNANKMFITTAPRDKQFDQVINRFRAYCKECGLRELWDYQVKGNEVRFSRPADLAMIRLGWKDNG